MCKPKSEEILARREHLIATGRESGFAKSIVPGKVSMLHMFLKKTLCPRMVEQHKLGLNGLKHRSNVGWTGNRCRHGKSWGNMWIRSKQMYEKFRGLIDHLSFNTVSCFPLKVCLKVEYQYSNFYCWEDILWVILDLN